MKIKYIENVDNQENTNMVVAYPLRNNRQLFLKKCFDITKKKM